MKLKDCTRFFAAPASALTVLVCCLIVVIVLQGLAAGVIDTLWPRAPFVAPALPPTMAMRYRVNQADKRFLPDGSVHLMYPKYAPGRSTYLIKPEDQEMRITDKQDRVLFEGKRKDIPFTYIEWAVPTQLSIDAYLRQVTETIGPMFSGSLCVPVLDGMDTYGRNAYHQYWRYDIAKRVFAGYDWRNGERPFAGSNGVKSRVDQVVPFEPLEEYSSWTDPQSNSPLLLWLTRSRLYQIDFPQSSIQVLFETGGKRVNFISALNWRGLRPSAGDPILAMNTSDGGWQVLWGQDGRKIRVEPPTSAGASFYSSVGVAVGRLFLRSNGTEGGSRTKEDADYAQWLQRYRMRPHQSWMELYEVSDTGQTKFVSRFEWTSPAWLDDRTGPDEPSRTMPFGGHLLDSSPPAYSLAWQSIAPRFDVLRLKHSFAPFVLAQLLWALHPVSWAISLGISLALSLLALWHGWARRTSWWSLALWLVLVVAFGLAGLLTYLGLNHTPVIRCPACGRKRNLQRSACPACNASLPAPAPREVDLLRPV